MSEYLTTSAGDRVAYDRRGDGPGLVFIAGAGPFRAIDPVTTATAERAAAQGLTTIVYDRLGRGESPAEGALDLDRELAAVAALIALAGGSAVLCGHSSGCAIALAAAARGLPVTGLVLWEAPLASPAADTRTWITEVERRLDGGELEGALDHYMKDMPAEWREGAKHDPQYPQFVAQVVSYRADGQALVWAQAALEDGTLGAVTVPVSILIGTETFPVMVAAADGLAAALPNATSKRLAGANHSWESAAMADELVAFVNAAR